MTRRHAMMVVLLLFAPRAVDAQCIVGPDAESRRALRTAFEAQSAVSEHLDVARMDRESRELVTAATDPERRHTVTGQATMTFGVRSVRGFSVCDELSWEPAKLSNQILSGAAGIGARGLLRLELRALGVSDSIVQRNLADYYPEREAGLHSDVPGAAGAGHGLWSARLEVLDEVGVTVGRVSSHSIRHTVGWEEETDEDGNTSITKSHTQHWSGGTGARTFVALSAPRIGTTDLIIGDGALERFGLSSPWIVPRPRQPIAVFRVDGEYDGLIDAAVLGFEVSPVAGVFANPSLPAVRIRGASELTSSVLREASVGARLSKFYTDVGAEIPGELWALDLQGGVYGGERLRDSGVGVVPGGVLSMDLAVPIIAIFRVSSWAAVNRPGTIQAVPAAAGRPEWGVSFYVSYASK